MNMSTNGNGEHPDEHPTGRHHVIGDEPASGAPATQENTYALLKATATKVGLIEERSAVWDDSVHAMAALHQSVIRLSVVTTDLHRRVLPFTFSRIEQVGLIVGASLVGSMVGGGIVVWIATLLHIGGQQ
jgi:hypothetical protein